MGSNTQLTTGKVHFSFCNLFTPKAPKGSEIEKYSVTLLIPKTDKATLNKINTAIEAAKTYYAEKTGKKSSAGLKSTLHDGDKERPAGGEFGPECKGQYVITVSSLNQPVIVDADKTPITDSKELYSGCYGRAVINFYVFDRSGNRGITAGLNGVMKLYDGEPLAGGVVTDADWDSDYDDWNIEDNTDGLLD
jgi:hypothetical protein